MKRKHAPKIKINKKEIIENILWIVLILLIFYIGVKIIGLENVQERVEDFGIFGPLIFIFLKIAAIVIAPLSGTPLYLIAGTLFGVEKGILYLIIGDAIGFTISFYISRILGKKIAIYFLSKTYMNAANKIITHIGTTKGLVQSCFVFIGFPEVVSYAAGLTKIKFRKFIFTIVLIELIPVSILVYIAEATTKASGENALIILTILTVLIVVLGIFWLYNEAKKNRQHKLF
jgi:uncharacterized membrane protein YdjX (TVP38/TMEM64 family)